MSKETKKNVVRKQTELLQLIKTNYKKNAKTFNEEELVKVLKKMSDTYYNTGTSIVEDEVYDYLKDLLKSKDPENPFLDEVGAPVKGTKNKVKLPYEMGSLAKIKPNSGDLDKFRIKYSGPYVISDKLDGASVQLYKDKEGKLTLYSRGNGEIGQDISHLIGFFVKQSTINKIPNNTSVRGELIISKKNFKSIESYMKNARNAVSGLVNSKTVDTKIAKITEMICYSVLYPKYKQSEQMNLLESWNLNVVFHKTINKLDEEKMKELLLERKKTSSFEMDGLVCVDNSKIYSQTGGYPDHAFAFKMLLDDQTTEAEVVGIEWDVSMDGYVKPRVKINPVNLSGTKITYATGFNAKFIQDNNLGPGAKIKITRSGDVIPYILEVLKKSKSGKPDMPKFKYNWNETQIDIIIDKSEKNMSHLIKLKLLIHFFSTMEIKYLGEGILAKFVDAGLDSVVKILTAKKKDFENMEGVGDKMLKKIYDEINRAFQEVDLAVFMGASHKFGRGLGVRKIEEVLAVYPDIIKQTWTKSEMIEKIQSVPGFAEKTATLFAKNYQDFIKFYEEIKKVIDISRFETNSKKKLAKSTDSTDSADSADSVNSNNQTKNKKILEGQKIVFTGFRDSALEKNIKLMGGKVSTSVSSNTTLVIHSENPDKSSSKFTKAIELKIKMMSITDFKNKYKL